MSVKVDQSVFAIEAVRHLTDSTYILRFTRNGMQFKPGQHLVIGLPGSSELREYSIYSGTNDSSLEVLIKEVDEGLVSRELKALKPGEKLDVRGPYGFFLTKAADAGQKLLLISSGTGIAPFHSFVRSHPNSDYQLIHGIRTIDEAYEAGDYDAGRFVSCTSRDTHGDFHGRVTDYLLECDLDPKFQVYLCGNSNMIFDAMDVLRARGIRQRQIFTEVYF